MVTAVDVAPECEGEDVAPESDEPSWDDAILGALTPEMEAVARSIARRPAWASLAPTEEEVWRRFGRCIVEAHARTIFRAGLRSVAPKGVRYFASGGNDENAMSALLAVGLPPGMVVSEVTRALQSWLYMVADGGGLKSLFLDSGAFSETVDGRLTDEEWRRRLGQYEDVLVCLGEFGVKVYVVAPDCVGDQEETLRRLTVHRKAVRALKARGARVIVPVQPGARSMAAFWREAVEVLGPGRWVAGIPCKRGLTSPLELARFMEEARPESVHLLGLGPTRSTFHAFLRAAGSAKVSCDSGFKRRLEGTANGAGGGPRAITRWRPEFAHLGSKASWAAVLNGAADELREVASPQLDLLAGVGAQAA